MAVLRGHGPTRGHRRGAIDGGKIWWVAPTYTIAQEIWRDLKRACRLAWSDKSEVERRIELPSGGSVTVKSADDPEGLVGVGLAGVVIDEAAKVDRVAWYQSIRPTLSDTGGWCVFIGTPKGFNWIHELFQGATGEDWARWQRPTSDNPLIPADELEAARRDSPAFYGQEYEAQFQVVEGAEWPASYFGAGIWFDDWPTDLTLRVIALDPSKGKQAKTGDYSAFVWLARDCSGGLWCDADLARRPKERIIEDGLEIYRRFRADGFGVESNAFQELLADDFARISKARGIQLPVYLLNNTVNKEVRIRRLGPYLSRGTIRFKGGSAGAKLLVSQLQNFPGAAHDDGCFVAGTMVQTVRGPRPIERIRMGDMVATRQGYAPVILAGCTGIRSVVRLSMEDGRELVGTGNHPVFDGDSFTPMHSVRNMIECRASTMPQNQRPLSLMESSSADTQRRSNGLTASTTVLTPGTGVGESALCTRKSGKARTGQFRQGIGFITETMIRSITPLRTLSASRQRNMTNATRVLAADGRALFRTADCSTPFERSHPNGTVLAQVVLGIVSMPDDSGRNDTWPLLFALTAEQSTRPHFLNEPSSAQPNAASVPMPPRVVMRAVNVVAKSYAGKAPVYNLHVAGAHEYIANGFLVHNCDALEMALRLAIRLSYGPSEHETTEVLRLA